LTNCKHFFYVIAVTEAKIETITNLNGHFVKSMEVRLAIFIKRVTRAAALAAVGLALPFALGASPHHSVAEKVEGMERSVDALESKVLSTMMFGGSSPISFSGDARLRVQYHNLGFDAPGYMEADKAYLQSGWEGGENLVRLGMVVRPGRNTVLWSKIGFHHTLVGNYRSVYDADGYSIYPYRHDKARNNITISEDMSAGIAVRTTPASFWVRMGNTMWTEASPLTVWKAQPRNFAWEFLPFEIEQPIARYYEYNIAKGEKIGRAAWNKKPFNGLNVESINLPLDLYANFVYGTFERYDNFEREYVDFANDIGYADGPASTDDVKLHGIGDSYRHVIHGRLAKAKTIGDLTLGLNYVGINYKEDVLYASKGEGTGGFLFLTEFGGVDSVFYKEPKTFSVDVRGPIGEKFAIHADVALSVIDTTWLIDPVGTNTNASRANMPGLYTERGNSSSDPVPAFFTKLNYNGFLPIEADIAYIGKGFYSPFSFAAPMDAFFAYGANMIGAGKFIARGEGSPYVQNMAGVNLTFAPKLPGYGHFRFKYGQHLNIEEGRDVLFFPYRLNGYDMYTFFHSSYNRWGNSTVDNSLGSGRPYKGRLGDESFNIMTSASTLGTTMVAGPSAGGLRSDYLSMFEGFVPYKSADEAYRNFNVKRWRADYRDGQSSVRNQSFYNDDGHGNIDSTHTSWVPESKKYTFNLELDAAYDIGPYVGYRKDLFFGGYVGMNGVTSSFTPLEINEKGDNTMLWSFYLRLEPAIALTKDFYILGLFGYENWRAKDTWMMADVNSEGGVTSLRHPTAAIPGASITSRNFVPVPIDYVDMAYGIGFDWDMLERVGLHGRVKWMTHEDRGLNNFYNEHKSTLTPAHFDEKGNIRSSAASDWSTPVISLEVKAFF